MAVENPNGTPEEILKIIEDFFHSDRGEAPPPSGCESHDFYSDLLRDVLKPLTVERGRVSCLLSVKPSVVNDYGGFHGGAIAAVAEMLSIACARTVVAEDKDLFLGELGISYLSAAPKNSEVVIEASIVRSGRNLTIVAVEMKLKETGRLLFTARATFYNMPVAKL